MWVVTSILNILAMVIYLLIDIEIAIYLLIEFSAAGNELDIKEVVIEETIINDT